MIEKLKAMLAAVKSDLVDTYKRTKIVLLAIGAVILALEFNKIKTAIAAYMGKKELEQATKKDEVLNVEETALKAAADKLVADSNALPGQQKPVGLDWNKK